ncbi:MAG: hypothetical protein WCL61_02635 [bacterium]
MTKINYSKKEIFTVLTFIQNLLKTAPANQPLKYSVSFFGKNSHQTKIIPALENEILCDLERLGALKIVAKEQLANETIYDLKILPKFKDVSAELKKPTTTPAKTAPENQSPKTPTTDGITIIHLEPSGNLWREPKTQYCYRLGEDTDRHLIVRCLAENNNYQQVSMISRPLKRKSANAIAAEVTIIRNGVKKYLDINGSTFLEAKKGSGYKIGPTCKIQLDLE